MTSYEDATDENTPRTGSEGEAEGQDGGHAAERAGRGLHTEVFLFGFWDIPVAKVSGRVAAAGARSWLRIERSSRLSASGLRGREGARDE